MRLAGGAEAPARARRALAKLRGDLDEPTFETLRLLVSEIVGNSIRHAHSDAVNLSVSVGPRAVLTEVTDSGNGFEPSGAGTPRADHTGWGLFIVERLADSWGVAHNAHGTCVWFELRRA